jgi:hypothetical protein
MDMVISMLGNKCLPKELLGDVVSSVTYVLNICPNKEIKGHHTPKKCWSRNKFSVSHFKEFGLIACRHVLINQEGNLMINQIK